MAPSGMRGVLNDAIPILLCGSHASSAPLSHVPAEIVVNLRLCERSDTTCRCGTRTVRLTLTWVAGLKEVALRVGLVTVRNWLPIALGQWGVLPTPHSQGVTSFDAPMQCGCLNWDGST